MKPVALITGGEGDLAKSIGTELKQAGFDVLAPGRAELDVTDKASVKAFFAEMKPMDLLVNNAGVAAVGSVTKTTEADLDRQ